MNNFELSISSASTEKGIANTEKPSFQLGWTGWIIYGVCNLLVILLALPNLEWDSSSIDHFPSYLLGSLIGLMIIAILPAWLVWRFAPKPGKSPQIILGIMCLLFILGKLGDLSKPQPTAAAPEDNMTQAMAKSYKQINAGKNYEAGQTLINAIDKQAASGGADAVAASVISQVIHELEQYSDATTASTIATGKLPAPEPSNPNSYDVKQAGDDETAKVIAKQIAFERSLPDRIDEIVKAKNQSGLDQSQVILGFKAGILKQLPILLNYSTAMQKSYSTGSQIYALLKSSLGKWHADTNGKRIFDDPALQQTYNQLLAANIDANQQIQEYKSQLLELQKKGLQGAAHQ